MRFLPHMEPLGSRRSATAFIRSTATIHRSGMRHARRRLSAEELLGLTPRTAKTRRKTARLLLSTTKLYTHYWTGAGGGTECAGADVSCRLRHRLTASGEGRLL